MSKLVALLAVLLAGALAAVFYWRKNGESWNSTLSSAKDTGSSWTQAAAHESAKAADKAAAVADDANTALSDLADGLKESG